MAERKKSKIALFLGLWASKPPRWMHLIMGIVGAIAGAFLLLAVLFNLLLLRAEYVAMEGMSREECYVISALGLFLLVIGIHRIYIGLRKGDAKEVEDNK